ncbi:MAG: carotenoid biosynthesis protein [Pricia sp.]
MTKDITVKQIYIAAGIIWLFHISALIGITLGYVDWFIEKTPLNLCICLILFIWVYPIRTTKHLLAFLIFFSGGMLAEWIGVKYGLLFGTYEYGGNFGPKVDGVPYLIGAYWALLTFITASISEFIAKSVAVKIVIAATLMTFLDYFMEHSATRFDFWEFKGGLAPIENYITWFVLALLFQGILRYLKTSGNRFFALHLYAAQLIFFVYLYFLKV